MTVGIRRAPYAAWRALAATVLVMTGAVGAHTLAGGHVPDGALLVALGSVVFGCSLLLLHGYLGPRLLLSVVGLAQVGLHVAFSTAPAHHGAAAHDPWTWQMLLAHAGVTLLTALVWRGCSRAAEVLLSVVRTPRLTVTAHREHETLPEAPRPRPTDHVATGAPRRGPPVVCPA